MGMPQPNRVPYSGASRDVNLGSRKLSTTKVLAGAAAADDSETSDAPLVIDNGAQGPLLNLQNQAFISQFSGGFYLSGGMYISHDGQWPVVNENGHALFGINDAYWGAGSVFISCNAYVHVYDPEDPLYPGYWPEHSMRLRLAADGQFAIGGQIYDPYTNGWITGIGDESNNRILIGYPYDDLETKLQVEGKVKAAQFQVDDMNEAPASASDAGTPGEIRFTADYIYVCVAPNTWKRAALSTWT